MKRRIPTEYETNIRLPGGEIRRATIKKPVTIVCQCQNCKHVQVPMSDEPCNSCGGASGEWQLWEMT